MWVGLYLTSYICSCACVCNHFFHRHHTKRDKVKFLLLPAHPSVVCAGFSSSSPFSPPPPQSPALAGREGGEERRILSRVRAVGEATSAKTHSFLLTDRLLFFFLVRLDSWWRSNREEIGAIFLFLLLVDWWWCHRCREPHGLTWRNNCVSADQFLTAHVKRKESLV